MGKCSKERYRMLFYGTGLSVWKVGGIGEKRLSDGQRGRGEGITCMLHLTGARVRYSMHAETPFKCN